MKKIEIIVGGDQLRAVTDLLDRVKASGYTIIRNVSGRGHHGVHEGQMLFNDLDTLDMIITVVPKETVDTILAGVVPLFQDHSGVVFISDVTVIRRDYFVRT